MENIIGNYKLFLAKVLSDLREKSINLEGDVIDHLAYRCTTEKDYESMKKSLIQ